MMNYADEKKIGKTSLQWTANSSSFIEVTALIYLLEIVTKVGRHFPILFLSLASLNILLATNDFLASSIEFGILNSLFATSNFVSLAQIYHRNKIQSFGPSYNETNPESFLGTREAS